MSYSPPKRIQDIIDGTDNRCSHCNKLVKTDDEQQTLKRCSRCRVARYCSAECQKNHFVKHKKNCKNIAKKRASLDKYLGQADTAIGTTSNVYIMIEMAHTLVSVGYHEKNKDYYREALKYYITESMELCKDDYHKVLHVCGAGEDKILLLLVVLGGDDRTIMSWIFNTASPRIKHYLEGWNSLNDVTFQVIFFLCLLRQQTDLWRDAQSLGALGDVAAQLLPEFIIKKHIAQYLMGNPQDMKTELGIYIEANSSRLEKAIGGMVGDSLLMGTGLTMDDIAKAVGGSFTMGYVAEGTPYLMGETDGKGLGSIVLERISLVNHALRRHNPILRVRLKEMSEALTAEQVPRLFRGDPHFNEIAYAYPSRVLLDTTRSLL